MKQEKIIDGVFVLAVLASVTYLYGHADSIEATGSLVLIVALALSTYFLGLKKIFSAEKQRLLKIISIVGLLLLVIPLKEGFQGYQKWKVKVAEEAIIRAEEARQMEELVRRSKFSMTIDQGTYYNSIEGVIGKLRISYQDGSAICEFEFRGKKDDLGRLPNLLTRVNGVSQVIQLDSGTNRQSVKDSLFIKTIVPSGVWIEPGDSTNWAFIGRSNRKRNINIGYRRSPYDQRYAIGHRDTVRFLNREHSSRFRTYRGGFNYNRVRNIMVESYKNSRLITKSPVHLTSSRGDLSFIDKYVEENEDLAKVIITFQDNNLPGERDFIFYIKPDLPRSMD